MTDTIYRFEKEYRFLSNFWRCDILFEDITYPTAEHAYQAAKTTDQEIKQIFAKLPSPADAKKLGQTIELRRGWDKMKVLYMRRIVEAKFSQHPDLMEKLLATQPGEIIEGNNWGDTFWGQCPIGKGKNELGKILMSIRDDITRLE